MSDFCFTQDNTRPYFAVQLLKIQDEQPVVLTGATVAFYMRHQNDAKAVVSGSACVVTDAVNGLVEYRWGAGNLAVPGIYDAEFRITFSDATIQSVFVNDIEVREKLG